jgi:hypothetical protein
VNHHMHDGLLAGPESWFVSAYLCSHLPGVVVLVREVRVFFIFSLPRESRISMLYSVPIHSWIVTSR